MESKAISIDTFRPVHFSWFDPIILLFLIIAIIVSLPLLRSGSADMVKIYLDNTVIADYPLDNDRIIEIQGKTGPMKIRIKNRSVSVVSSSCQHQICVQTGSIRNSYNQIVCIPNHILISLTGKSDRGIDAVAK